jgi:hypothetical protein
MADIYFDPRSGDPITGDEFIKRYTVNAFMFVERPKQAAQRAPTQPGLPAFGARCVGCGTSVPSLGETCAICSQKPEFAKMQRPMLELGEQPVPAYAQNERTTRVVQHDDTLQPGTVIDTAARDEGV